MNNLYKGGWSNNLKVKNDDTAYLFYSRSGQLTFSEQEKWNQPLDSKYPCTLLSQWHPCCTQCPV